jgi:hypothetical protein
VTYRWEIGFPMEPTEKDLKKLKREVARDRFGVMDGGKQGKKETESKKGE